MIHGQSQDFFNGADFFVDRNIRQGRGHKVAVYTETRNYTYNDVQKMMNKTANAFRELGVRVDDRVLILMLDVPQFYAVFWGAIKMGAVPIPVNTMLTPGGLRILSQRQPREGPRDLRRVCPLVSQIKGDLLYLRDMIVISETKGALIPFRQKYRHAPGDDKDRVTPGMTSASGSTAPGSTGSPKGAIHSQYDMVVAHEGFGQGVLGLTEDDIVFSAARSSSLTASAMPTISPSRRRRVCHAQRAIHPSRKASSGTYRSSRPPSSSAYPRFTARCSNTRRNRTRRKAPSRDPNAPHELSSVRICFSAGEALPPEIYHRWKKRFGLEILDGLGTTEMLHIFICNRPGEVRPGATGQAGARIRDEACSTTKARTYRRARSARLWSKAEALRSSTGGNVKRRASPCRANGSTRATSITWTPTATTGAQDVATTCSRSGASGYHPWRSRTASWSTLRSSRSR